MDALDDLADAVRQYINQIEPVAQSPPSPIEEMVMIYMNQEPL